MNCFALFSWNSSICRFADLMMELSIGDGFAYLMQFIHCCIADLQPLLMEFFHFQFLVSFVVCEFVLLGKHEG
ncbi:hypothetical protein RchiOBHm_Chr2g0112651 [Rosa chinensis]|uniref:Uncharacterized protein n=1 Tax=Rosa chinensis TaxID=74649 RepID=A0A2P6RQ95_ROSCH|nr:hypothetical protein RchiOBHm_Chr2g0112651 [Rosa chinensis]